MDFSLMFMLTALKAAAVRVPITLAIAGSALIIGALFGILIALARFFRVRFLAPVLKWTVTIVKGIPVILIIIAIYIITADHFNNMMEYLGIDFTFRNLNKAIIAIVALSIPAAVGLSEAFRGALASVGKGQYDAAYSVGHTHLQLLWRIVLPQALPVSLPTVCGYSLGLTKAVSLASMITVLDVLNGALQTANGNYRYLEAYLAAAIVYWMICVVIENTFTVLERHFGGKLREIAG
ncbi:MAG: ABC transporter permease subunit [Treponema sp.]|jgi:L-cystine transport system permease protein|nr:ABC transporter permease subunit [Treponema sp.]